MAHGLFLGAAAMAPSLVLGQEGPEDGQRPPRPALIAALDANDDGEISAEEIKNASAALAKLDHNKDGTLDRSEFDPRPERSGGPRGARRGPDGPPPPPEGPGRPPGARRGPDGPPPPSEGRGRSPGARRGPDGPPPSPEGPGRPPGARRGPGGPPPEGPDDGPQIGRVLPPHSHEEISLTADQAQKIEALEKEVKGRLESILTPEQIKQLRDSMPAGPGGPPEGPGGPPPGRRGPGGPPPGEDDGPPVRPQRPRR